MTLVWLVLIKIYDHYVINVFSPFFSFANTSITCNFTIGLSNIGIVHKFYDVMSRLKRFSTVKIKLFVFKMSCNFHRSYCFQTLSNHWSFQFVVLVLLLMLSLKYCLLLDFLHLQVTSFSWSPTARDYSRSSTNI